MGTTISKRRRYFIKDSVQPALIVWTYLILLAVILISGTVFYFIGKQSLTNEYYQAHSAIETTMDLLLPGLIFVNVIGLLGASLLVIVFTHSIAGPIYRLKMLSERIASGDLTVEVQFRKKDTVHELSTTINKIIKGLNSHLKQFSGAISKLRALSDKINDLDQLSANELLALKKGLVEISAELAAKMKQFNL